MEGVGAVEERAELAERVVQAVQEVQVAQAVRPVEVVLMVQVVLPLPGQASRPHWLTEPLQHQRRAGPRRLHLRKPKGRRASQPTHGYGAKPLSALGMGAMIRFLSPSSSRLLPSGVRRILG